MAEFRAEENDATDPLYRDPVVHLFLNEKSQGNYLDDELMRLLRKSGFDPDLPTYVIWESNTMYLTLDDIKAVMEQLRNNLSRFHFTKF